MEHIPNLGMPCSALIAGVGCLVLSQLTGQALFTPHGRTYPLVGVDGGGIVGGDKGEQEEELERE